MEVCVQEMTHLTIVSNLITSLGGSAHFFRTAFPIRSGYFPSDFVMNLEPFDLQTLKHFIFLERSSEQSDKVVDTEENVDYKRGAPKGRLMTHGGDYATVGELYETIKDGIHFLSQAKAPQELFCGLDTLQIKADEVKIADLKIIADETSAIESLDLIIEQGEGGTKTEHSHFEMFCSIQAEYDSILIGDPGFKPARNCAKNPIMRKPAEPAGLIWINDSKSASFLDLANALYDMMLRTLVQIYSFESRSEKDRSKLLDSVFEFMHTLAAVGSHLTTLPAGKDYPGTTAGMSFAINRHFSPLEQRNEILLLKERLEAITDKIQELARIHTKDQASSELLHHVQQGLSKVESNWASLKAPTTQAVSNKGAIEPHK